MSEKKEETEINKDKLTDEKKTDEDKEIKIIKKFEKSLLHKKINNYTCESDLKVVKYINILVIGEKGAGKSSLISTFYRSLNNDYKNEPVANIGDTVSTAFTKKKKSYKLNKSGTIITHDTRGLETLLIPELEQIKAIRDGKIKDDVIIKQKENWGFWDYVYGLTSRNTSSILDPSCLRDPKDPTTIQELPHAIIFVVPANQRRIPEELEDFVSLFTEYGYKPIFAVTKIDCHDGKKGDLYAATHRYDSKKEELMDLFDLEYDRVKPIQNYTQWDKREKSIENLSLDLLNNVIKSAESFILSINEKKKTSGEDSMFSNCIVS